MNPKFTFDDFVIGPSNSFAHAAAFRGDANGSLAPTGHLLLGPYVPPDTPELVANGDFAAGFSGWVTTGDPLAVVDGALQSTGNGGQRSDHSDQTGFLHRFSTLLFSVETMFQLVFPAGDPQQKLCCFPHG